MADTKTKEITVQGVLVEVSQPYAEGHTLTEAEAKALNQVRAENIGNNVRKTIKDMVESADGDVEKIAGEAQKLVADKDKDYEFTLASVGSGTSRLDPLTKECRSIARAYVNSQIKAAGMTLKDYKEKNGDDAIDLKVAEVAEHEKVIALAKKNLKQREEMADLATI